MIPEDSDRVREDFMRRCATTLALVLALTSLAVAGDDVLRLASGDVVVGKIVSTDDAGVTLAREDGEAKFDWASLTPLCQYEIRADRVKLDDPEAHEDLARYCLSARLYPHARSELATARSLNHPYPERLAELSALVEETESEEVFARIAQLTAEEEYEKALEEIRTYLRHSPVTEQTKRAKMLIPDLLRRIDSRELREQEEAEAAEKAAAHDAKNRRIEKLVEQADKARDAANGHYASALKYSEIGNITRTKKGYLGAEKELIKAYTLYRKVQRIVQRGVVWDKMEQYRDAVRKKLLEVYLGMARLLVRHRNYKEGVKYVNKALYLDPVNKEALDLRQEIDENRIRRSASRMTNTPGGARVTSGGGASTGAGGR
jgi:tetratricopeptide (TPR) repeat protein